MKTLLKKAQALENSKSRPHLKITDQHIDLTIALLIGSISMTSYTKALGIRQGGQQAYTTATRSLIEAYRKGKIKIK